MKIKKEKIFVLAVLSLLVLQILVILLSWIISTVMPELMLKNLLSGNGIRWFWSTLLDNLGDNCLSSILLLSVSLGSFVWSGLPKRIFSPSKCDFREKFALKVLLFEIFVFVIVAGYVVLMPHSPLLGIDGNLLSGPLAACVLPVFSLSLLLLSETFAFFSGRLNDYKSAEKSLIFGIQYVAPLIVIWFQVKELFQTLLFCLE